MSALLALAGRALADAPVDRSPVEELEVEDAELDAGEVARSASDAGAALIEDSFATASGLIDVASLHDLETRHHRPSKWGRLDLAIAWRSIERPGEPRRHEMWLVATWRH